MNKVLGIKKFDVKNLKLTIKIINYEKIKTLTQFKILAIIIIIQQKKVRYR